MLYVDQLQLFTPGKYYFLFSFQSFKRWKNNLFITSLASFFMV